MKKSIALLSVLLFMLLLFGVVASIFSIYQKYSNNNFANIINQNSELISDVKNMLKKVDINSSESLKNILTTIPFSSNNGDFRGIVNVSLISNRINLNEYLKDNKINPAIDYILDKIFEKYEISDSMFLKNLILDTLDSDVNEREAYSEIKFFDKTFPNGYINKKILKKILDYYYKKRDDKSVYKIPWDKYFIFLSIHTPIYCEFVNKNILDVLNVENDVCENLKKSKIANKLDIISFDKNKTLILDLNISYILNNQEEKMNIIYDLNQKKVIDIESYPLY